MVAVCDSLVRMQYEINGGGGDSRKKTLDYLMSTLIVL